MNESDVLKLKQADVITYELGSGLEFKNGSYIKSDQFRAFRQRLDDINALAAKLRRERGL